jgi:hypothetical protein
MSGMNRSKVTFLVAAALCLAPALARAQAFTAVINTGGFGDATDTPANSMNYGLVIDTAGNGFADEPYLAFTIDPAGGYLSTSGGLTDDLLVFTSTGIQSTVFSPSLGDGSIGSANFPLTPGTTGAVFAVMWFAANRADAGDAYGLASHALFTVPSAGGSTVAPEGWLPGYADITFAAIPEPRSLAALAGLALLATMIGRRRRVDASPC